MWTSRMKTLLQTWTRVLLPLLTTADAFMVQRVYVPEDHFLLLVCELSQGVGRGSGVEWRHGLSRLEATGRGTRQSQLETKHLVFTNGSLYIADLEESDSGLYYCNNRLAANVTVLAGQNFVVYEGRTLYLSCKPYGKSKQRWMFKRNPHAKREFISSWFKNGTFRQEREDPDGRFVHTYDHLQILRLRQSDSGSYLCNGNEIASVTVRQAERGTNQTATTESTETRNNIPQKPRNAVMLVAILAVFVMVVVFILLSVTVGLKIRNRKKVTVPVEEQTTDLWKTPDPRRCWSDEEHSKSLTDQGEIQYASLGQQNWRPGGWSQDTGQQVIYSTLLLKPANPLSHTSDTVTL
ncbi:uncharacterized protein LOC143514732 isoform X2 [Brachyhypopomus gauderio]|uniref:uncharacterized protein LOC143514732 isoform X2 n=1 Tax=Brachyhypopomus gauderio TaxID=698409 RepID=UPI004041209C